MPHDPMPINGNAIKVCAWQKSRPLSVAVEGCRDERPTFPVEPCPIGAQKAGIGCRNRGDHRSFNAMIL